MDEVDDEELNAEEAKERKILRMLLKIKNGTPPQRKTALRQITDKARDFGAGPLFNQILPLLMSPTLEDQERHLLVKVRSFFVFWTQAFIICPSIAGRERSRKSRDSSTVAGRGPGGRKTFPLPNPPQVALEWKSRIHLAGLVIDRVLYKLDDLVRPYVHKILVVIEPLLIDEDYYARVEGREIISNLAKAAGLATMIATMRPDIDNLDEYVRNTTARAFAV
ncbi:unnamed protein product, partial [Ectocarpus sp. 8 AP-2014]